MVIFFEPKGGPGYAYVYCSEFLLGPAYKRPGGSVRGERANFTGLVIGCMDTYDSERRPVFQRFSSSTSLAMLVELVAHLNKVC